MESNGSNERIPGRVPPEGEEVVCAEYDSGWKEAIEQYFAEFLSFFFPTAYAEVNLDRGYEFLDKELERVVRDAAIGRRLADKLARVYLRDGTEEWLLIHLEVQGYHEQTFAKRMYSYNYRILDRYDREVISLAILTDEDANNIAHCYEVNRWGFRLLFDFPLVKLVDYRARTEELEASMNPFGIIVLAHLRSLETRKDMMGRLSWKLSLVKMLYEKGYDRQDILNLYKFIDWLMVLPEGLSLRFHEQIEAYEEEKKMAYVTTAEKIGRQRGMQEGLRQGLLEAVALGLELKFGEDGLRLSELIDQIDSTEQLEKIKETIRTAASLQEIEALIVQSSGDRSGTDKEGLR